MNYDQGIGKGLGFAAGGLAALLLAGDARAQLNYDQVAADLAAKASLAQGYTCTLAGTISDGVVTCSDSGEQGIVAIVKSDAVETVHFLSRGETTKTEVYNNGVLQSTTTFRDKNPLMRETYGVDGMTVISREVNDDADQYFDRGESFSIDGSGTVTKRIWMVKGVVRRAEGYDGNDRTVEEDLNLDGKFDRKLFYEAEDSAVTAAPQVLTLTQQEFYDYADGTRSRRITYHEDGKRTEEHYALGTPNDPFKVERYNEQNALVDVEEYSGAILRRKQTFTPGNLASAKEETDTLLRGTFDSLLEHDEQGRLVRETRTLPSGMTSTSRFSYSGAALAQVVMEKMSTAVGDESAEQKVVERTTVDYDSLERIIRVEQQALDVQHPNAVVTSVVTSVYEGDSDVPVRELWDSDGDENPEFQRFPGGDWEELPRN